MKFLQAGGTIGVIAPAGPSAAHKVDAITPWLAARGFRAKIFPGCHEQKTDFADYLAGSDAVRLRDLHAAFADPGVDAIICMRGGYGCARLMDGIDYALVRRHAKPFVGYSDITSLHIAFNQLCDMATIHAPMMTSDFVLKNDILSADVLFELLTKGVVPGAPLAHASPDVRTVVGGIARGRLCGGNLTVVNASLGTPWAIDARGGILFLEEVGEDAYKVDRMLNQLRLAGVLDDVNGFVIGRFSDADDASAVIEDTLASLGKPMVTGWQAGHCAPNYAIPMGVAAVLDADACTLALR